MVLLSSSIPLCKSAHLCLSVWNEDCLVFHAFFCHLFVLKTFITVVQIRWWSLISCASKSFLGKHNYIRNLECLFWFWCSRIVRRLHYHFYISNAFAKYEMHFTTIHQNGQKQCFFKSFFYSWYTISFGLFTALFGFIAQHSSPIWHLKNLIRSVE